MQGRRLASASPRGEFGAITEIPPLPRLHETHNKLLTMSHVITGQLVTQLAIASVTRFPNHESFNSSGLQNESHAEASERFTTYWRVRHLSWNLAIHHISYMTLQHYHADGVYRRRRSGVQVNDNLTLPGRKVFNRTTKKTRLRTAVADMEQSLLCVQPPSASTRRSVCAHPPARAPTLPSSTCSRTFICPEQRYEPLNHNKNPRALH